MYIEREALLNLKEEMWQDRCDHMVVRVTNIMNVPAADVVQVVRCKDCVFAKKNYLVYGLCLCEKTIHDAFKGEIPRNTLFMEDDFCSYGERKPNEKEA